MEANAAHTKARPAGRPKGIKGRPKGTLTMWAERIDGARRGAVTRGLKFGIDAEYIERLFNEQGGKCAISGLPLWMDFSKQNPTASLDRRESHRGYVKGNMQWFHKVVNIMKSNHDEAYFVAMCKQIADHRGGAEPLSRSQREALAGQPQTSRDRLTKSID